MIYTFYSYKGGVGRSMAVANVGEWLYLHGLRVVLVDWDLEAPGLEAFFPADDRGSPVPEQTGLMDLLLDYKEDLPYLTLPPEDGPRESVIAALTEQLPSVRSRLTPLHPPVADSYAGEAALWILPAGRRAGDAFATYAQEVQRFDWSDFYRRHRGEAFFEWLRRALLAEDLADVVLIDTRTGISEMGGVSTRQLADVIVSLCAPNTQNIEGVAALTQSFTRKEVIEARGGRSLELLVVPTRIENSETDARNWARREFSLMLDDLRPAVMQDEERSFWDLRIPYVPKYAYRETLAVGASDSAEELEAAYEQLARQLLALAPVGSRARERLEQDSRPSELESVPVPAISNVPPRLPLVVGRQALLSQMRSQLTETSAPLVLYGLGGVGKTTLAIEYAHRFQPAYEVCWWIDAYSPAAVARGYAELAEHLGAAPHAAGDAQTALRWLMGHAGWLLILDGADDPVSLMEDVPSGRHGHVVITSRNPGWGRLATALEVSVLERSDSIELLVRRTGDVDAGNAGLLAEQLGDLPLAIEQACAYMDTTGRSIASYLDAFKRDGTRLLARGLAESSTTSIREVFEDSYRQVLPDHSAHELLALCSMLAAPIPVDLAALVPPFDDPLTLADAISGLRRFSLVSARGGELWVQPLLKSFVHGWLTPEEERAAAAAAVGAVRMAFPSPGEPGARGLSAGQLLSHALAAIHHATTLDVAPAEVVKVMVALARHLRAQGNLSGAADNLAAAMTYAQRKLETGDPIFKAIAEESSSLSKQAKRGETA